jgi:hypothetical protein
MRQQLAGAEPLMCRRTIIPFTIAYHLHAALQPHRAVENQLLKLANSISALKRQVDVLGTAKDTVSQRHRIRDLNTTIQVCTRLQLAAASCCTDTQCA